jgi:carboxypeptidase A1
MRHILVLVAVIYINSLYIELNADPIKSYDGYTVQRFTPTTKEQLEYLRQLEQTENELDFWTSPTALNVPVDIMFSPHLNNMFSKIFNIKSITKSELISDVGALIEKQRKAPKVKQATGFKREAIPGFWNDYQRLAVVFQFLDAIVAQNPSIATLEVIGKSYQNQDIRLLQLGVHTGGHKPIYFMDSAIHAREWITTATTTYFIQYLVDQYAAGDPVITNLLNHYDFYFIPVLNPDGYEYTFTNDRLWRKTRAPAFNNNCVGTDPNRNFNHQWMVAGASADPCSQTYAGAYPNDQPEVKALQDYLLAVRPAVYYAVHSYSQVLIYPWGNTTDLPPTAADLQAKGENGTNALTAVYGTQYRVGSISNLLYLSSGNACDFAYEFAGAKLSYVLELRDLGYYGFLLPPDQITATGNETNAFFVKVAQDEYAEARAAIKNKISVIKK